VFDSGYGPHGKRSEEAVPQLNCCVFVKEEHPGNREHETTTTTATARGKGTPWKPGRTKQHRRQRTPRKPGRTKQQRRQLQQGKQGTPWKPGKTKQQRRQGTHWKPRRTKQQWLVVAAACFLNTAQPVGFSQAISRRHRAANSSQPSLALLSLD
jgi:ribosomal protein L3